MSITPSEAPSAVSPAVTREEEEELQTETVVGSINLVTTVHNTVLVFTTATTTPAPSLAPGEQQDTRSSATFSRPQNESLKYQNV